MDPNQHRVSPSSQHSYPVRADYNAVTLVFEDPELETQYRSVMHEETLPAMRFGIILAIILFVVFGFLDWWLAREQAILAWQVRAVVVLASAVLLGWSFTRRFARYQEFLTAAFGLFLSLALIAICIVLPEPVADQYYVGHLLIIMGAYTLFGPRFPAATFISICIFIAYVLYEHSTGRLASPAAITRATFVLSAVLLAGFAGYIGELTRRLAFYRSCVIEHERERSAHSALHDPLTGLPNRRLFMEKLAHAVTRDNRFSSRCAVLFSDIDAFKAVNDVHGHVFGDKLLRCVADRLHYCVRTTDTVARFGGDEFVVLLEDVNSFEHVQMLQERISDAFAEPCEVDGIRIDVVLSVGRALHPGDGESPDALIDVADRAMYRMKRQHGRR